MMSRTEDGRLRREREREQRSADRANRLGRAEERQRSSNAEVYGGQGSMLERENNRAGNIYDVATGNYNENSNKQGLSERIQNDGIDELFGDIGASGDGGGGGGGDVEFNGSVLICINGSPYYIDIAYDTDAGVYDGTGAANFPIVAP